MQISKDDASHLLAPLLCFYIPWRVARMLVPGGWGSLRAAWKEAYRFKWRYFAFTLMIPLYMTSFAISYAIAGIAMAPNSTSLALFPAAVFFNSPFPTVLAIAYLTRNSVKHTLLRQAARIGVPVCTRCAYEPHPGALTCPECGAPSDLADAHRIAPTALAFPALSNLTTDEARRALTRAADASWFTRRRFRAIVGVWFIVVIVLFGLALPLNNRGVITILVFLGAMYPLFAEWRIRGALNRRLNDALSAHQPASA